MRFLRKAHLGMPVLALLAALSGGCYLAILCLSQSLHVAATGDHRLLLMLAIFGVAFVCHLVALRTALRLPAERDAMFTIVAAGIVFRLILLFSDPIEEIDLYRYLWDGAVTTTGVNPYRYSPEQVSSVAENDDIPEDLRRLVQLRGLLASRG